MNIFLCESKLPTPAAITAGPLGFRQAFLENESGEASWGVLRASRGRHWGILGRLGESWILGGVLGAYWGALEHLWVLLGASWRALGRVLGLLGGTS